MKAFSRPFFFFLLLPFEKYPNGYLNWFCSQPSAVHSSADQVMANYQAMECCTKGKLTFLAMKATSWLDQRQGFVQLIKRGMELKCCALVCVRFSMGKKEIFRDQDRHDQAKNWYPLDAGLATVVTGVSSSTIWWIAIHAHNNLSNSPTLHNASQCKQLYFSLNVMENSPFKN